MRPEKDLGAGNAPAQGLSRQHLSPKLVALIEQCYDDLGLTALQRRYVWDMLVCAESDGALRGANAVAGQMKDILLPAGRL